MFATKENVKNQQIPWLVLLQRLRNKYKYQSDKCVHRTHWEGVSRLYLIFRLFGHGAVNFVYYTEQKIKKKQKKSYVFVAIIYSTQRELRIKKKNWK